MTQYFEHRDASKLELASSEWYVDSGVELHVGDRVTGIDRDRQVVHSANGEEIAYDKLVIATGSTAFFPPIPGTFPGVETHTAVETSPLQPNLTTGVFGYRTLKDLDDIIEYAEAGAKRCAVLGGGLLGLEAAKAAYDLGCEVHVVEFASRLMPRQVDDEGSKLLVQKIEDLGLKVS
jgi:nitrite reductase (NADH) large subunit